MMVRLDAVLARQMNAAALMTMLGSQVPMLGAAGRDVRSRLIEVVGVDFLLGVSLGHSKGQDEGEQ